MFSAGRALWRLARVFWQGLRGLLTCALLFPFITPAQRMRQVGAWSSRTLAALGIALEVRGAARAGPVLFTANHISWLDILAINAVHPARFVSKADVRHWPVLGWMVACGGTLFIERERKRDALRVVHQVAEALKAGETLAVFPEGTTSDGRGLLPFHANLLQAAISTETPVQAIALRYADATAPVSLAATYIGDTTLAQSLRAVLFADRLRVRVELLPAQGTRHLDRRALAERLHNDIADALGIERNALAGAPGHTPGLAADERPAPLVAEPGAGGTATV
jgi:1-acyl-sn-glycerol-3-phosphate acyltransferase